ncbi:MAG: hypothetical protein K8R31_11370 [Bacteroidales bacterium]|nr:hypothetical protein [Bacteroidales bacterium]
MSLFLVKKTMGQQSDSLGYRNVIKYNLTAPMLWGIENYIFEYERVLSPTRTFSIELGYRTFPKLIGIGKTDSALIVRDHKNKGGISATIDYRFYLKKENKYSAPRGVYVSPYINYFNNKVENTVSTFYSDLASSKITTQIDVFGMGAQLGYQFVFYNRLSLDICIIGPSIAWYNINMKVAGSINIDDEIIDEEMVEIIRENYPIFDILFDDFEINERGRISKLSFGYRYYFKVGFLF